MFVLKFLLTNHIVLSGFMINNIPPIFVTVSLVIGAMESD